MMGNRSRAGKEVMRDLEQCGEKSVEVVTLEEAGDLYTRLVWSELHTQDSLPNHLHKVKEAEDDRQEI